MIFRKNSSCVNTTHITCYVLNNIYLIDVEAVERRVIKYYKLYVISDLGMLVRCIVLQFCVMLMITGNNDTVYI